ncbi:MAG: SDR family oxidoreductase [Candidatus Rokubacteria bacterium]|nr:SDR family oxidoreductase [Candidatus Rokubacteria bacterium]
MISRFAIVTGGTGALGQAVTLKLLAEGMKVAVPWVVPAESEALAGRVAPDDRSRLLLAKCDVTDASSMAEFVGTVVKQFHGINVLVTAVGGFAGGGILQTDLEGWNRMMTLNLTSTFIAARAVVPWMRGARYGRIVTVASRAVVPPAAGFLGYTVAKAGVIALTQALAAELKVDGITVNSVLPSTMDTPGNRAAMPDEDPKAWTPVESVAGAIAFLARTETAHVTGALVTV